MNTHTLFHGINESLLKINETHNIRVNQAKESKKGAPPLPQSFKRLLKQYSSILQEHAKSNELSMR